MAPATLREAKGGAGNTCIPPFPFPTPLPFPFHFTFPLPFPFPSALDMWQQIRAQLL